MVKGWVRVRVSVSVSVRVRVRVSAWSNWHQWPRQAVRGRVSARVSGEVRVRVALRNEVVVILPQSPAMWVRVRVGG